MPPPAAGVAGVKVTAQSRCAAGEDRPPRRHLGAVGCRMGRQILVTMGVQDRGQVGPAVAGHGPASARINGLGDQRFTREAPLLQAQALPLRRRQRRRGHRRCGCRQYGHRRRGWLLLR